MSLSVRPRCALKVCCCNSTRALISICNTWTIFAFVCSLCINCIDAHCLYHTCQWQASPWHLVRYHLLILECGQAPCTMHVLPMWSNFQFSLTRLLYISRVSMHTFAYIYFQCILIPFDRHHFGTWFDTTFWSEVKQQCSNWLNSLQPQHWSCLQHQL